MIDPLGRTRLRAYLQCRSRDRRDSPPRCKSTAPVVVAPGQQASCRRFPGPMPESAMTDMTITLSERAARRISEIVADEPSNKLLRVSVEGGGCSGFQYKFDLV